MTVPVRRWHLHNRPAAASSCALRFLGRGASWLIGPESERWGLVMLVSQRSVQSFLAFAQHDAYLAGTGHRTAAIQDSRRLPLSEQPLEEGAA